VLRSCRKIEILLSFFVAIAYFFSNPKPQYFYDYTFRIAGSFLKGKTGLTQPPPSWLNEFVPFNGSWYSVFPLGSVISMLPFAALEYAGFISVMPAAIILAGLAGGTTYFLVKIARNYGISDKRIILFVLAILFGTFAWTNLTFGGAWQIALGFSMFAQTAAIYFTFIVPRPFVAGCFFAIAFGNRTEVLLTAPIFIHFITDNPNSFDAHRLFNHPRTYINHLVKNRKRIAAFCVIPFILGVATLSYNYARFGSFLDFGYSRIPGVLAEPWYNHGIFSIYYIPRQIWEMLFKPWEFRPSFYLPVPNGFSSSILISSPFLLLAFRRGSVFPLRKGAAWLAIALMTFVLWMHGNSGGWQFGYRYWMSCLPWVFLILLESAPAKISKPEKALIFWSILINLYATWLFHWTDYLRI